MMMELGTVYGGITPQAVSSEQPILTGRIFDRGTNWIDDEVKFAGAVCTTKTYDNKDHEVDSMRFLFECLRMNSLRHPNIVQSLGVYCLPTRTLPVLITERMETSLHETLEKESINHEIPLAMKQSILLDVSCGLSYLHSRAPVVIHGHLTAKTVLLDAAMRAKIAMIPVCSPPKAKGNEVFKELGFLPPEAIDKDAQSLETSLDIFSFGTLALFTLVGAVESQSKDVAYTTGESSEIDRCGSSIDLLRSKLGKDHPLVTVIKECLQDSPDKRPSASNLVETITKMTKDAHKPNLMELTYVMAEAESLKKELEKCQKKLKECKKKMNKVIKKKAKEVHKKHASHLLDTYSDVTAVDVGYREKGGVVQEDGDICILVWVKKKLPVAEIQVGQLLPKEIDGVSVDVLEGEVDFTADRPPSDQSGSGTPRESDNTNQHPHTERQCHFMSQLLLSQESQPGDSGALVVEKEDKKTRRLLFANSRGHGEASPIGKVEHNLGVKLLTSVTD